MKRILLVLTALMVTAGTALAATPALTVTPHSVKAGGRVTLAGAVGTCDPGNDAAQLYSAAFKGVAKRGVTGLPTLSAHLNETGHFKISVRLSRKLKAGSYAVRSRCRGRNFARTTLKVS